MTDVITTQDAASQLNMSQRALQAFVHRNPDMRPATKIGSVFVWTEDEIEAVRQKRIELRKRPNLSEINAERNASRSSESS